MFSKRASLDLKTNVFARNFMEMFLTSFVECLIMFNNV